MQSESTTDHHPVNETMVHPVEPVLGTTPLENCWLQTETNPRISQTFKEQQHMMGMYELQFKLLMAFMSTNQSVFCP